MLELRDTTLDAPSEDEDYGRAVIEAATLRELKRRSDAKGLVQLGSHLVFIALTGAMVWAVRETGWVYFAMFVHGIGLVFLFAPLHESVHRTAFKTRGLNDAVARACGFVLCLGPEFYRSFHFAHHRYTQIPGKDPELAVKDISNLKGYLVYLSGWSYWLRAFQGLGRQATGRVEAPFVAPRLKPTIVLEARIALALYGAAGVAVAFGHLAPLLLWFGPMVLAQPVWRAWLLAEHTECANNDVIYENTRTTYTNPVVRWLMWQMSFHAAHHAYPGIPFHALARTDALIKHLDIPAANGYARFHGALVRALSRGA